MSDPRLASVIAAAADPYERSVASWCRPVPTAAATIADRRSRWARTVAGDSESFDDLLRRRGISAERFERMLSDVALREPLVGLPAWARQLRTIIEHPAEIALPSVTIGELFGDDVLDDVAERDRPWRFQRALEPLVAAAHRSVTDRIDELGLDVSVSARHELAFGIMKRLAHHVVPAVTSAPSTPRFEVLNIVDISVFDSLLADRSTPQEWSEAWLSVFELYPVLGRVVATAVSNWQAATVEFLERLHRDRFALTQTFVDGEASWQLMSLRADAGDVHRAGRSVCMLVLLRPSDRSTVRILYKPKNLEVATGVLDLVASLAGDLDEVTFEPRRLLTRSSHTWEEFVESTPCDADGVTRFYLRYGMIARVVQALRGYDITYENILAVGEHPEIIDLETMFRPVSRRDEGLPPADAAAIERHSRSAASTAMFTAPMTADAGRRAADMSPLAPAAAWSAPFRQPRLRQLDDGSVRAGWDYIDAPRVNPVPRVLRDGHLVDVQPADFFDEVLAGYSRMDAAIARRGPEVRAALDRFRSTPVRFLNRNSHIYARLIQVSLEPSRLLDGIEREMSIDRLWKALDVDPHGGAFIEDEVAAVRALDIPLFQSVPGTTDVITNADEVVAGTFAAPALDAAVAAIAAGDDGATAAARSALWCVDRAPRPFRTAGAAPRVGADGWRTGALEIARSIWRHAVRVDGDVAHLGVVYAPTSDAWTYAPLRMDRLSGTCGIVVVLSLVATENGDDEIVDAAHRSVEALVLRAERAVVEIRSRRRAVGTSTRSPLLVGGLLGLGSALEAIGRSARLLGRTSDLARAIDLAGEIDLDVVAEFACDDRIGGRRGLIGNLDVIGSLAADSDRTRCAAIAAEVALGIDPDAPRNGPYPPNAWIHDLFRVDRPLAAEIATAPTQDVLRAARQIVADAERGPADPTLPPLLDELHHRHRRRGAWFPDLRVDDRHFPSATFGLGAIAEVFLAGAESRAATDVVTASDNSGEDLTFRP